MIDKLSLKQEMDLYYLQLNEEEEEKKYKSIIEEENYLIDYWMKGNENA